MKEEKSKNRKAAALSDDELGAVSGGKVFNPRFSTGTETSVSSTQKAETVVESEPTIETGRPTATLIQPDITIETGRPVPTLIV